MVQYLKSYLFYGNYFCAVEHTSKDDKDYFYCTVLKKKKKEIIIHNIFESDSLNAITNKIKTNWPIVLIINNSKTLTKNLLNLNHQKDNLGIISSAFPNVDISNFYFEIIETEKTHIVSICRKALIDNIIQKYTSKKLNIIDFSIGNSCISSIVNYLETSHIYTSNSKINFLDNNIHSIEQTQNKEKIIYYVNGLEISNKNILSFTGALGAIIFGQLNPTNFKKKKEELIATFKNTRIFNLLLKTGLVFILTILLINFSLFNFYFEKVKKLEESSQVNHIVKNDVQRLMNDVDKSQKIVNEILKNKTSKSSYYVNDLINRLPKSILLSELNFQPLQIRIKKDNPIQIEKNMINISGTSNNSSMYSLWIKDLEQSSWIQKIEVANYSHISKTKSNFTLKVYLKDE